MDEKEIARIVGEALGIKPNHVGVLRGWNMTVIGVTGYARPDNTEQLRVREALIEAERRTATQFGMVRFL